MEDRGEELRRARAQGGARTESRLQPGHKKTELTNRIIENNSGYWQKEETESETNNAMILRVKKLVIQLHGPAFFHNPFFWGNAIIIHFISLV